jgi:anhydro-N-acetylmuramic acid kinase
VRELTGRSCDTGGEIAARGRPDIQTVRAWLEDPFFRRDPPRSTGRELFGDPFYQRTAADTAGLSAEDRVATVTWFTALSIARSYEDFVGRADEVILSGGGARNPTLVGYLASLLAPLPVVSSDAHGLPTGAKEALAFALLGLACLDSIPANVPRATGARRRVVLGKIVR